AGVDDVLDDDDVLALDRPREVRRDLDDARGLGRVAVALDADELHRAWQVDVAHQIGEEDDRALQDADEDEVGGVLAVVVGDALAELGDAGLDRGRGEEFAAVLAPVLEHDGGFYTYLLFMTAPKPPPPGTM